jgi:hypothetical protein
MKRLWSIVGLLFVAVFVLLLLIACFVVWHIIASRIGSPKDFWDIATAVGTVGAAVAAVWIALRQNAVRHEEELVRVRIVASRLIPKLTFALEQIRSIEAYLAFTDEEMRKERRFITGILRDVQALRLELNNADLTALAALPNRAGFRLAHGIGQIELVESRLTGRSLVPLNEVECFELSNLTGGAFHSFRFALEECNRTSGRLIEISNIERFGEWTDDEN